MTGIIKSFPELPGWTFDVDEVSAGVFRVRGGDQAGRTVETRGVDPDAVLEECKNSALRIQARSSVQVRGV